MLGVGIWQGVELGPFGHEFEVFIIPSRVPFWALIGFATKEELATFGNNLLSVDLFIGVHACDL